MNDRPSYRVGDLIVDAGRGRVMRGPEEIPLPKLSFDLLLTMVRAAPNLLSLDELMTQVWPGVVVSPETVIHRVKVLRDALGDDPKSPRYIAGLRGRGYQIIVPVEVLHGAQPNEPAEPAPSPGRRQHPTAFIALVALALIAPAATWWHFAHRVKPSPTAVQNKVIAILPFRDLSEKQDQAYFAEGMAEEIRNLLGTVPDLKVIGHTSASQFRSESPDVRKVGAALGAAYVVEGSVRRANDKVRLTAQLTDVGTGTQRWSQTYDRDVSDILRVQQEIATAVVRHLQLEVAFVSSGTSPHNSEAYDLYLRGMHASDRFDQQGFEEGIAHFRRALELDPTLVRAAEELALDLSNLASWGYVPADVGWERTREAAEATLRIEPRSVRARAVLADRYIQYKWDWPAARRELMIAIAQAPNDPTVLAELAVERIVMGQREEALRLVDAALTVEPVDPYLHFASTWIYLRLGRLSEAEASARRALEISPTYSGGHFYLAQVLLSQGRAQEVLTEIEKEPDPSSRMIGQALAYFALGRRQESDAALARLEKEYGDVYGMYVAEVYAYRGQKDRAFEWLDRAYTQRDPTLWFFKQEVLFKSLESDPRYKALLHKMRLPE